MVLCSKIPILMRVFEGLFDLRVCRIGLFVLATEFRGPQRVKTRASTGDPE